MTLSRAAMMLARSSVHSTPRWLPSANVRPSLVQFEHLDVNWFRREPQARASSSAGTADGYHVDELQDGTLVFTFHASDTPSSSSQKEKGVAPEPVAHIVAEPAVDRSTAPHDENGAGKRNSALQPDHQVGEEVKGRAGAKDLEAPAADASDAVLGPFEESTVRQLTQLCKDRGLKGYSVLNKASLVELLTKGHVEPAESQGEPVAHSEAVDVWGHMDASDVDASDVDVDFDFENADLGTLTVKQLKSACKQRGLKGYSGLRKQALVGLLSGQ